MKWRLHGKGKNAEKPEERLKKARAYKKYRILSVNNLILAQKE
jgi:hypothetical protein